MVTVDRPITQKQIGFATDVVLGKHQNAAYEKNYDATNMSQNAISVEASRLMDNPKVSLFIAELRTPRKDETIADLEERKRILTEILRVKTSQFVDEAGVIDKKRLDSHAIRGVDELRVVGGRASVIKLKLHDKIHAIAEMNKMEGSYAPERHEVLHGIVNVHIHPWEAGKPFKQVTETAEE